MLYKSDTLRFELVQMTPGFVQNSFFPSHWWLQKAFQSYSWKTEFNRSILLCDTLQPEDCFSVQTSSSLLLFAGVSKSPSMPLEPEPDVDSAPCPPTDHPGSPEPIESAKPRTAKKKSKVEAWKIAAATVWESPSGSVVLPFPLWRTIRTLEPVAMRHSPGPVATWTSR